MIYKLLVRVNRPMIKPFNCFFLTAILFFSGAIHAEIEQSKYCPLLNQINYDEGRLFAYNSENKLFSSGFPCSFCDDITYIQSLSFVAEQTKYNAGDKTLRCVYNINIYYLGGIMKTELKELINRGDY